MSDVCKHEETYSDGDSKWCSDCGAVVGYWDEIEGWVEANE